MLANANLLKIAVVIFSNETIFTEPPLRND